MELGLTPKEACATMMSQLKQTDDLLDDLGDFADDVKMDTVSQEISMAMIHIGQAMAIVQNMTF